jgi:protein-S-isoprenylcysteine O-methyltransferase Ste14
VPVAAAIVSLVVRTALQDRTLRRDLEGYAQYTRQTRWRLVPGVW